MAGRTHKAGSRKGDVREDEGLLMHTCDVMLHDPEFFESGYADIRVEGSTVVSPYWRIKAFNEAHASKMADVIRTAFNAGKATAQRDMRKALGLEDG